MLALIALAACRSWLAWADVNCPLWAFALTWLMNAVSLPQAAALLLVLMLLRGAVKLVATPAGSPILPIVVMRFWMAWATEGTIATLAGKVPSANVKISVLNPAGVTFESLSVPDSV